MGWSRQPAAPADGLASETRAGPAVRPATRATASTATATPRTARSRPRDRRRGTIPPPRPALPPSVPSRLPRGFTSLPPGVLALSAPDAAADLSLVVAPRRYRSGWAGEAPMIVALGARDRRAVASSGG